MLNEYKNGANEYKQKTPCLAVLKKTWGINPLHHTAVSLSKYNLDRLFINNLKAIN